MNIQALGEICDIVEAQDRTRKARRMKRVLTHPAVQCTFGLLIAITMVLLCWWLAGLT